MARRKHQDNMRDILILINQSAHPRTLSTIEKQKKVLQYMASKPKQSATRKEIEKLLECEFSKYKKGESEFSRLSKQFYIVMTPLFRTLINNREADNIYELSEPIFIHWFESLRRTGKELFK